MIGKVTLTGYQQQSIRKLDVSRILTGEVLQWCYVLCLPIVGLLVLILCLYLGGIFALFGPWAILIAARACTKRFLQATCASCEPYKR